MRQIGIGVVGCGVISKAYMTAMKRFPGIRLAAVADMRIPRAPAVSPAQVDTYRIAITAQSSLARESCRRRM